MMGAIPFHKRKRPTANIIAMGLKNKLVMAFTMICSSPEQAEAIYSYSPYA